MEERPILQIAGALEDLGVGQMGVEPFADPSLLFPMWGGKDPDGSVTRWLAKDRPARVSTLRVQDLETPSASLVYVEDGQLKVGGSAVIAHNETTGLQGGNGTDEFYHLTAAQAANSHAALTISGAPLQLTGQLLAFLYAGTDFTISGGALALASTVTRTDGSRAFTATVAGVSPEDPEDLATKGYVDSITAEWDFLDAAISLYDPTAGLPMGPSTGDRYVSTATANGWTINNVYEYNGSTWDATVPTTGQCIPVGSGTTATVYIFTGSTWKALGGNTTAPLNELIMGTGSGYTSSSALKYEGGALRVKNANGFDTVLYPTDYSIGDKGRISRATVDTAFLESNPLPDTFVESRAYWGINTVSTAAQFWHVNTDAEQADRRDLYPFAITRQGIIAGSVSDPDKLFNSLATSTIAQLIMVYDGTVGPIFRGTNDMGPTDRFGTAGVYDRNVRDFLQGSSVFAWAYEIQDNSQNRVLSITPDYLSRIMAGGLNMVGGRDPGLASTTMDRATWLHPEYLVNGAQPAHVKHGIDVNDDRTMKWTYTYNPGTYTVTIPAGACIWYRGVKYLVGGLSVQLHGGSPTTGGHYVYFTRNESTGAISLVETDTAFSITTDVPVCIVYVNLTRKDGASSFSLDERHNCFRNLDWHRFSHWAIRTRLRQDGGFSVAGYALNSDTLADKQPVTASGWLMDEDIQHNIAAITKGIYTSAYLWGSGTAFSWTFNNVTPATINPSTDVAQYNQYTGSAWVLTDIPNGYYANIYEYVTMADDPTVAHGWIVGQGAYATQSEAETEAFLHISKGDLSFIEGQPLRKFIIKVSNAWATPGKFRIMAVQDLVVSVLGTGSPVVPAHNLLSGRDSATGHPLAAVYGAITGAVPYMGATGLVESSAVKIMASGTALQVGTIDNLGTLTETGLAVTRTLLGGALLAAVGMNGSGHGRLYLQNADLTAAAELFASKIGSWTGFATANDIAPRNVPYVWPGAAAAGLMASDATGTLSWSTIYNHIGSKAANTVLAAPNGSGGVPSFRVLAAADIPSLAASIITSGSFGVARGGTGKASWTQWSMPYASATTTLAEVAPNTTAVKKVLAMTGTGSAGAAPLWDIFTLADLPLSAGQLPYGNDGGSGLEGSTDLVWNKANKILTMAGSWAAKFGRMVLQAAAPGYATGYGMFYGKTGDSLPYWRQENGNELPITQQPPQVLTITGATATGTFDARATDTLFLDLSGTTGGGTFTLTVSNAIAGGKYMIKVRQSTTATKTLALTVTSFDTKKTPGASGYGLSAFGANVYDLLSLATITSGETLVVISKAFA